MAIRLVIYTNNQYAFVLSNQAYLRIRTVNYDENRQRIVTTADIWHSRTAYLLNAAALETVQFESTAAEFTTVDNALRTQIYTALKNRVYTGAVDVAE